MLGTGFGNGEDYKVTISKSFKDRIKKSTYNPNRKNGYYIQILKIIPIHEIE